MKTSLLCQLFGQFRAGSFWRLQWLRLLLLVVFAVGAPPHLRGATVLSRAPNAAVYLGLPFAGLEFENPLAGTETVLGHQVLDWRDADYQPLTPKPYDDWNVFTGGGIIDGNANEIYMRAKGQYVWTATTVPSSILSVHLNGDNNDGVAQVLVDGVEVARVDMWTAAGCQTALVMVQGLANSLHTITVCDLGPGIGGTDVHVMGAAALKASDLKWNQPPVPAHPTNVFYGWNQPSIYEMPPIAADDWACTTTNPVTKIRWWGSFLGWREPAPPMLPAEFWIRFWTDVPKGADPMFPEFSHPGALAGQPVLATAYQWQFVGWDYDPRTQQYEACFLFEYNLAPGEWFYQQRGATGTNIYWLSIEAFNPTGTQIPWGWKTRPRDPASPAPDDAVMFDPNAPMYQPLFWPDPTNSWDLAFELFSQYAGSDSKWYQPPDLRMGSQGIPLGMDVNATYYPGFLQPGITNLLADDFLCTAPGPITNITIWGSWYHDQFPALPPTNVIFTLSFHQDFPMPNPYGYSMPGKALWWRTFKPGEFKCTQVSTNAPEGWYSPLGQYEPVGDATCFQYDFGIPQEFFTQAGNGTIYWLDVQAQVPGTGQFLFGWKTSITNWNDDATHAFALEPFDGPQGLPPKAWNRLLYPPGHPLYPDSLGLAFRLNYREFTVNQTKWSQPPMIYLNPPDGFNGWNETSVYGLEDIVADDWICTTARPVTDIHWWGSFQNWLDPSLPPAAALPLAFHLGIWTDVAANATNSFSHPGTEIWEVITTNYTVAFAGWDFDPRAPALLPESCFKFDLELLDSEAFHQPAGTNTFWLSLAAMYPAGQANQYPFGWKLRPRDSASPAPDDAVRIFAPTRPVLGAQFQQGQPIEFPAGTSWDAAFQLTTRQVEPPLDFGDAPDKPYPTLRASDGARHVVVPGVQLGKLIDAEPDGQPNATATGDDLNNLADEDGVTLFGSHLIPGGLAGVAVTASTNGYLSAWVDFNLDGSWATPGDQIFSNVWISAGSINLYFTVPFNVPRATNTFARFRFSTSPITNFTGLALDGEVEDYQWWIEPVDFGDAPDPPFPTLYKNNGAYHWLLQGVFLGRIVDAEFDGQPDAFARGDDNNPPAGPNDEDGVKLLTPLLPGQMAQVQVIESISGAWLNAWVDFGADGSWATPGDQIIVNAPSVAGPSIYNFLVPPNAASGSNVFARFRFSTMANLSFTNLPGQVPNGEVEDYRWQIDQLDFGDAPTNYPTLLAQNGARHVLGPLFMGKYIDAEPDGQPDPNAKGDDDNPPVGPNDEDGVAFNTALISGVPATVNVTCSGAGFLQGWIDFNIDGDWADPGEQIILDYPVVAGVNTVKFFVPAGMGSGKTFARFRLSSVRGLGYAGLAPDGEVEDYAVTLQPLKWLQEPELGSNGVDVDNRWALADDFRCAQTGPITDIHVWGSFRGDQLPAGGAGAMTVTLTIYADVPVGVDGTNSHPGTVLWTRTFVPGQYSAGLCLATDGEWWLDPLPPIWQPFADTNLWQLDFYLDPTNAFHQLEGTIYWLGVNYQLSGTNFSFGWKTTYRTFNDAACWLDTSMLPAIWKPLFYGNGHPQKPAPMHLAFALSGESEKSFDWGDAPDPPYPTLAANNGARHVIVPGILLGRLIDNEPNGQPNANATGDDLAGLPDEDGVTFSGNLVPGQPYTVQVVASTNGYLQAWIDFNADGNWTTAGDQVFADKWLNPGTNFLTFNVPTTASWGVNPIARFRFSTVTNLSFIGAAPDGEVEDYLMRMEPLPQHDLGDAPDSRNHAGIPMSAYPKGGPGGVLANYPTVLFPLPAAPPYAPIHLQPRAVAFLGNSVSLEWNADVAADQDLVNNLLPALNQPDKDGADDGVIFPLKLPHCRPTQFAFSVTYPAPPPGPVPPQLFLNVWFDWNRDGDWNDVLRCPDGSSAPEWAVQNQPVPLMGPPYPITVTNVTLPFRPWHPSIEPQPVWMRITLAEQPWPAGGSGVVGGDGPLNGYAYGETEDFYITNYQTADELDFGDAPPPYPTLLAANGARHQIVPGFNLGNLIDAEPDGLPDPLAQGDDKNNLADEDGVVFTGSLMVSSQACVNVTLTGPGGFLDGWIDFNRSSVWGDMPGEQVFSSQALAGGANPGLCFNVPTNAVVGTNFARFRLSSVGGLNPTGPWIDGEVEDMLVVVRQRAPFTNIVITNITITNIVVSGVTNQVATIAWNAETGIQYQLLACASLSNVPPAWTNVGPLVTGPANSQSETNALFQERYYRVMAPFIGP